MAFTDVAQIHTCKCCQGTIHSCVVCKSKCPKVDGHEEDNSLLSDDEIDMVVTLRMNRDFMKHMRLNYPEVIKSTHPRYGTIVSAKDLLDQNTKNNEDDEDLY